MTTYAGVDGNMNVIDVTACSNGLSPAADDLVRFKVNRDSTSGNDTAEGIIYCFGFQVTYT